MSEQELNANVESFEQYVESKDFEKAATTLLFILKSLDSRYGEIVDIAMSVPPQINNQYFEKVKLFATRIANGVEKLFLTPGFTLSEPGFRQFMSFHRWLGHIFAASPFINADHILAKFNSSTNPSEFAIDTHVDNLRKVCVLFFPESNINLSFDTLYSLDPVTCFCLCFALQSPRFLGTPTAFKKRHTALHWMANFDKPIPKLTQLPSSVVHDLYMHCSYDVAPDRHKIKATLNKLVRETLLDSGWQDRDVSTIGTVNGKPVMVVVLEHFNAGHSIYRTHSTSMRAARQHFYLVGVGRHAVDEKGRDVFDEFHELKDSSVIQMAGQVKDVCDKFKAAVLYMPSIGMDLIPIFVSNTRMAPIQVIALGHPATTYSKFIEYVVVEDDYVGKEECFTETLLRLPKDALPYVPAALAPEKVDYYLNPKPPVVMIGVAATIMKLNPFFLEACKAILQKATVPVHFHFTMGQCSGILYPYIERFLKSYLGDAVSVHRNLPYPEYLAVLKQCDMMINPFPFGNTNGIIDMVTLGLVGICKTGDEVHEHIDQGLFERLGLPSWLVCKTVDEYVQNALRLAQNHEERIALRKHIIKNNGLKTLFSGNPNPLGDRLIQKVKDLHLKEEKIS